MPATVVLEKQILIIEENDRVADVFNLWNRAETSATRHFSHRWNRKKSVGGVFSRKLKKKEKKLPQRYFFLAPPVKISRDGTKFSRRRNQHFPCKSRHISHTVQDYIPMQKPSHFSHSPGLHSHPGGHHISHIEGYFDHRPFLPGQHSPHFPYGSTSHHGTGIELLYNIYRIL